MNINVEKKENRDGEVRGKKVYETPAVESYKPLEIMSGYTDNSSELVF